MIEKPSQILRPLESFPKKRLRPDEPPNQTHQILAQCSMQGFALNLVLRSEMETHDEDGIVCTIALWKTTLNIDEHASVEFAP
jgi:hypothetical protein